MDKTTRDEFENMLNQGIPPRFAHKFADLQWEYNNRLAKLGGFELIPSVTETLYNESHRVRKSSLPIYKMKNYRLKNNCEFEELEESVQTEA